jgi:type IV pilus assembly protein PilY1
MKTALAKVLRAVVAPFVLTTWALTPVWADDTEIFFGGAGGVDASPNVLFIIDTSGSMGARPAGAPRNSDSKIDIVKDALSQMITQVNDVNIGLMRFSNAGGPVLYPVTYIDKVTGEIANEPVEVVTTATEDASENRATAVVVLDEAEISIGTGIVETGGSGSGSGSNIYRQSITSDLDDAVQQWDGDKARDQLAEAALCFGGEIRSKGRGDDCRKFNEDSSEEEDRFALMGFVFPDVEIPKNATVADARLLVTVDQAEERDFRTRVYAEAPNARDYQRGPEIAERRRLSPRVDWRMDSRRDGRWREPAKGEELESPNLAALVQAAVDHPNWGSTSGDLGFVLELDIDEVSEKALREIRYFGQNGRDGDEAELYIRWDGPAVETNANHLVGIKFNRVDIPRGVDLSSASLVLTPSSDAEFASSITVALENSDAPASFTAANGNVSARLAGASETTLNLSADDWERNEPIALDIRSLLQSRVNDPEWCGGDSLTLLVSSEAAARFFHATEGGGSVAPRLQAQYDPASVIPGGTCRQVAVSKQITAAEDDGETRGKSISSDDEIELRSKRAGVFRFRDFPMPTSAVVKEAYLTLEAEDDEDDRVEFTISIENVGNSNAFDSDGIDDRNFVGGVTWNVTEEWSEDRTYQSPDLKPLIDRVLARGWRRNNALSLLVSHESGSKRVVKTYEDNPLSAATLRVVFEDDGSYGAGSVRDELLKKVGNLSAAGNTPIQDTLYEAYQYYTGQNVVWGKFRGGHDQFGNRLTSGAGRFGPFSYTRTSIKESIRPETFGGNVLPRGCPSPDSSDSDCERDNGRGQPAGEYLAGNPVYQSPINDQCQANSHIVFLTDGEANDPHSAQLIKQVLGVGECGSSNSSSRECVVELAKHMQTVDMSDLPNMQKVTTHMVGFDFDSPWLEEIAAAGGGEYKTAGDLNSLVTEFRAILASVLKTNTSFVAPVSAINQFNRLSNLNDVYFAVFRPDSVPHWTGNLKRYRLGRLGGNDNALLDANGRNAVDPATGFFETTARSYWSATADGAEVELGGANANLPSFNELAATSRQLFTDISGNGLSASGNRIAVANSALSDTLLGVPRGERDSLIEWIRGKDVDDEDNDGVTNEFRHVIADPLHSRPVAVNYGAGATPDVTLFFGTNAGFLHAINGQTGEEQFSYLPRELLSLQADLRANDPSNDHFYGLDGSPAVWTNDGNSAGIRPGDPSDFARLYIGQRRGGRNYYALDVTDRSNPKLMWKIRGGTGDFAELGQTWGRPIPGKINVDGRDRDVLFLSGGHDSRKDGTTTKTTDSIGRAVYIVDALTGALIWSGGPTGGFTTTFPRMQYSMPAGLTVIDVDADGYDDAFYIGDTGGQVWRFDIDQGNAGANLVTGGVIADLALGGGRANNRRFYHSPDVALIRMGEELKLAISIGSGERPSPLSEGTNDKFFVIFQDTVYGAPASYETLYLGDDPATATVETSSFYDATDNLLQTGTTAEIEAEKSLLANSQGWFIDLERPGEKVLSTPLTFRNTVTFTTYEPRNEAGSCVAKAGTSRIYQVSLFDATAVNVWGDTGEDPDPQREYVLDTPSIVDEPVIICTEQGCELFAGPEQPPIDTLGGSNIVRASWRQEE